MTALRGATTAYRCPGCDREAVIEIQRTTLHRFGNNGLVYNISCGEKVAGGIANECLGQWFRLRGFTNSQSAIAEWNDSIIEMAASALGITRKQALALKERRGKVAITD